MFRCLRVPATALLLSALVVPTVHAGAAPQLNSGQTSVLVTSLIVLSIPLATSMGLAELSKAPFKASERNGKVAARTPAVPLPPMEVKQVATTPTGDRQVHLQVPGKADQTATLQWPAAAGDDPIAGFVVGQQVRFDPTDAGAGWTVKSAQGQALAYVPTAYAAGDVMSETL
ncbi:TPA: hypothetical protein UOA81_003684 [Stenotrophomonas maltophilia]|uniref:hypothetical protein n=1 Tax=Stenotrophomonas TaxID=40323 RepID=UPI000810A149|nr:MULTISPECIES: hypothetical protein [Stenotrophomonas]OCK45315.1 hypothetical protein BA766_19360 [Stenotrophomonas maltophilia]QDY47481.1 hypothetical protein DUW70_02475 [Stenotrophomonas maltophilia]HDS1838241.1 hypothetical protein [Stenotrophomonas maltophilia]HEL4845755.1 hypothetical protein [Stenotrophomonas maltophilia]HEL5028450.1 hypothetical protein [Stenotrophomonas maltophilia]